VCGVIRVSICFVNWQSKLNSIIRAYVGSNLNGKKQLGSTITVIKLPVSIVATGTLARDRCRRVVLRHYSCLVSRCSQYTVPGKATIS
jgi:hypothetical protein